MKTIWAFIKWAFRYEPRNWILIENFMKLWLALAAVFAVIFILLWISGATFEPVN